MFGEFKTPGGKLVRVSFDLVNDRLTNVQVSGDFFLYPEEALEPITHALDGLHVTSSRDELIAAISQEIGPDVDLVGFSPEAIAIAVERGIQNHG